MIFEIVDCKIDMEATNEQSDSCEVFECAGLDLQFWVKQRNRMGKPGIRQISIMSLSLIDGTSSGQIMNKFYKDKKNDTISAFSLF